MIPGWGETEVFLYPKNHHCCLLGMNIYYLDEGKLQIFNVWICKEGQQFNLSCKWKFSFIYLFNMWAGRRAIYFSFLLLLVVVLCVYLFIYLFLVVVVVVWFFFICWKKIRKDNLLILEHRLKSIIVVFNHRNFLSDILMFLHILLPFIVNKTICGICFICLLYQKKKKFCLLFQLKFKLHSYFFPYFWMNKHYRN